MIESAKNFHRNGCTSKTGHEIESMGDKTMKIRTKVKAGGYKWNHNQTALVVRSTVKAGGIRWNHNQSTLVVKSAVKAGGYRWNHNQTAPIVKNP